MKKLVLFVAALASLSVAFASDGNTSLLLSKSSVQPPHVEYKYYGFYGIVDYTSLINLSVNHDEYKDVYSLSGFTAVAGFQWRKESAIGVGFSYLNDASGSFSQIPIFLEFRSHYLRNRLTPYSAIQLGYSIPMGTVNPGTTYTKIEEGGITAGLEAGGRVAISRTFGVHLAVGYQLIQSRSVLRGEDGVDATRLPELYHHFKFCVGLNF